MLGEVVEVFARVLMLPLQLIERDPRFADLVQISSTMRIRSELKQGQL
jgi:hypothetical protein